MEGKGTDLVTLERSEDSKTKAKGTSQKHRTLSGKVEGWRWGVPVNHSEATCK